MMMICLREKKCIIARCMLTFGLVASLAISAGLAEDDEEHNNIDDPNFYFRLRPRLGHFANVDGYLDLYEEYFNHVVRYSDNALKTIDINDWRGGRPTGEQCVVFLEDFQVRQYRLAKPFDIIILDACLDWLYADLDEDSSEAKVDYDMLSSDLQNDYEEVKKDTKLREIFDSTKFKDNKVPAELTKKLHEYFSRLLKVNADNPRNWCHSLWVEGYNDFIEEIYLNNCDEEEGDCVYYGFEGSEEDSYLNLIRDSTKSNSKVCYNVIQKQMVGIMHKDYQEKSGLNLFVTSKLAKQAKEKKWGQEMIKILQLASGQTKSDNPIVLSKVVESLNNIKENDQEAVEKFTEALGEFAIHNVDVKVTENDEKGRKRYRKAMEKLCSPYINPKNFLKNAKSTWQQDPNSTKKPFEFYNLIYNLIRMTNHEEIYEISKSKFENDVMDKGWIPLYLATFACQIISTTWGTIDYTTNTAAFQVSLRNNAHILIDDWPLEEITNRLVHDEENDIEAETKPKKSGSSFVKGFFGSKPANKPSEISTPPPASQDQDDESDDEDSDHEEQEQAESSDSGPSLLEALGVAQPAQQHQQNLAQQQQGLAQQQQAQGLAQQQQNQATGFPNQQQQQQQPVAFGQPQAGQAMGFGQPQMSPQMGYSQQQSAPAFGMPQQQMNNGFGYQQPQMGQSFNAMQQQQQQPVVMGIPVQSQSFSQQPAMGMPMQPIMGFSMPQQTSMGFAPQQQGFQIPLQVAGFAQPGPQTLAYAQQYAQLLGQVQPTYAIPQMQQQQPQFAPQQLVPAAPQIVQAGPQLLAHEQQSSSRQSSSKQSRRKLFRWLPKSWYSSSSGSSS